MASSLDEAAAVDANRAYAAMAAGPAAADDAEVEAQSFPYMASDDEAHAFLQSWGCQAVEQKALKRALQEERRDVAEWIVARDRTLLSQPDRFGRSVLWWAVYDGCEDTARWTVERGADTTFKETKWVESTTATATGLALPTPPPPSTPTPTPTTTPTTTTTTFPSHPSGTSVLSVACGSCSTDLCRFLIEHGAAGDVMQPGKAEEVGGSLYVDQTTVVRPRSRPRRLSGL